MIPLKYNPSTNHKTEEMNYYITEQEESIATYDQLLSPPLTMVPTNWLTSSSSPTCSSSISSPLSTHYSSIQHHDHLSIWPPTTSTNATTITTSYEEEDYYYPSSSFVPQDFEGIATTPANTTTLVTDADYHYQVSPSSSTSFTLDIPQATPHYYHPSALESSLPFISPEEENFQLLQQLSKQDLIHRVLSLEKKLILAQQQQCHHSSDTVSKQDGWKCKWVSCDKVTSTLEQLTEHLYRVHVGRGKANYYCGWIGCNRHDKPFTKRHKMHNHLRTHTGERPFVCNATGCHKRFSRPDSLSTHLKTHSNVRPFVCADCGKSYFHARSLRKHLKASNHASQVNQV